jgi:hypothetical protein
MSSHYTCDSRDQIAHNKYSSLAYSELYITLGTLFRRFDKLKVYNTGPEDLVYDDYFSSYHPVDARKFHVIDQVSFEQDTKRPRMDQIDP